MAKTKRQIKEDLKLIDLVVELLDARIPISSRNPDIEEITKGKKKIIVLNKSDLAEEKENQRWLTYYSSKGIPAVLTDSQNGKGIGQVINKIEEVMKDKKEEMDSKGRTGRKIRVMILGIPNVGKSSFINRISKKTLAGVGNKPGVTKQKQWIRINEKVELLDTPGVLWPKFESNEVALHLAFLTFFRRLYFLLILYILFFFLFLALFHICFGFLVDVLVSLFLLYILLLVDIFDIVFLDILLLGILLVHMLLLFCLIRLL